MNLVTQYNLRTDGRALKTIKEQNLEEQNYHMDTFEIQFSYVPPIFCSEQVDDGSFLNTGFYFLEYNFEPEFTP